MIEVYYIEDDETIADLVKEYLAQQNCSVLIFRTISEAKRALLDHLPTLILIDWNLPDGQGNDLCSWIRIRSANLPIIFLTVRGDSHDIVAGFQNGADAVRESKLFCNDLVIDKEKLAVYYQQEEITVSQPEYHLLLLLMENKWKTVT